MLDWIILLTGKNAVHDETDGIYYADFEKTKIRFQYRRQRTSKFCCTVQNYFDMEDNYNSFSEDDCDSSSECKISSL